MPDVICNEEGNRYPPLPSLRSVAASRVTLSAIDSIKVSYPVDGLATGCG
jgi:hypothetical protein